MVRRDGSGESDGAGGSLDMKWVSVMFTKKTMVLCRIIIEENLRFWRLLFVLFCCHCIGRLGKNARKTGFGCFVLRYNCNCRAQCMKTLTELSAPSNSSVLNKNCRRYNLPSPRHTGEEKKARTHLAQMIWGDGAIEPSDGCELVIYSRRVA